MLTMLMLEFSMEATEVEAVARATAVPPVGLSHVVEVFNVTKVDGIDAISYVALVVFVGAFGSGGGREDKHDEVED